MSKALAKWILETWPKNTPVAIPRPLKDFVLVAPIPDSLVQHSGLVLPETAQDPLFLNSRAIILAMSDRANSLLPDVLLGDVVIVPKFGGTVVKRDGREWKLYLAIELLAKVEG